MGRDIHAYRAAQMRDCMAGKLTTLDENMVLQILKAKAETVKTEEIVDTVSKRLDLDLDYARVLTTTALLKLDERGLVMHIGRAYWKCIHEQEKVK